MELSTKDIDKSKDAGRRVIFNRITRNTQRSIVRCTRDADTYLQLASLRQGCFRFLKLFSRSSLKRDKNELSAKNLKHQTSQHPNTKLTTTTTTSHKTEKVNNKINNNNNNNNNQ
ncbi:unnamed protein product [Nesidiocoris tenuis]|uniref:Uncharacterized protein n=1 Tax=Nesidiocoris tenuis TaxID=355587 RepID=A0A6H5FYV4_9HEMI|nr:unnamed protein product [Nesidiocoris tenuis]